MVQKSDLENALKDAMRSKDDTRKRTLRMTLTNVKLAEVEQGSSLSDAELLAIIQKEVKSRQETISEAERAGRNDIVQDTQAEIEILREFLPEPFTQQQLDDLASQIISEVGATSMTDMGKVMKELSSRLEGRATGKEASDAVRRLLQSG